MNRDSSTGSLSYDLDRGFCLEAFNFAGVGGGWFFFFPLQVSFSPLKSHTSVWIYNVA